MKTLLRMFCALLGLGTISSTLLAQACESGQPVKITTVTAISRSGTATLIGFPEYANPSTPPKKYRKRITTGTMNHGEWSVADCPDGSISPESYSMSFGPANPDFWGNSTGSVSVIPVEVDLPNNRVKYRCVTLGFVNTTNPTAWGNLWAIRVVAGPNDFNNHPFPEVFTYVGQERWLSRKTSWNPYNFHISGHWSLYNGPGHTDTSRPIMVGNGPDRSIRDEWDESEEYRADGNGIIKEGDHARRVGAGTFPLAAGGNPELWPNYASAESAYGGLTAVVNVSPTEQQVVGRDESMGTAPLFRKARGTISMSLSLEDRDEDALARALAVAQAGSDKVAYRDRRTTGFSFPFSDFEFEVPLQIECAGAYLVHFNFQRESRSSSAGPVKFTRTLEKRFQPGHHKLSGRTDIETMQLHLPEGEVVPLEFDTAYSLLDVELEQGCPDSEAGGDRAWRDSVHVHLDLGLGEAGRSAGKLMLNAETITAALYSPAALAVAMPYGSGTEVVRDATGILRQVKAPAALADIVTLADESFEVRFYAAADVGAPDGETGIYALTGSPYVSYRFENPDPGTATRLRYSRLRGGQIRTSEFGHNSETGGWTFSQGNGLRYESTEIEEWGESRYETTTVFGADDQPVGKVTREIRRFPWGEETVSEIVDPDGAALGTYSEFNATEGEPGFGLLRLRLYPDGSFEEHTYDLLGRPLETIRPYSGSTNGSPLRRTLHTYELLDDADGDAMDEELTTNADYIGDDEVGRSHVIRWTRPVSLADSEFVRRSDIRCASPGAAWDANENLVTETLSHGPGLFNGRSRRVLNPDGAVTLHLYTVDAAGQQTAVTLVGAPNAAKNDVTSGRRTETITNRLGRVTSETVSDLASGRMLTAWVATGFDDLGRPTRIDYHDGTHVIHEYACCGLASERDRSGVITTYQYDALGRQYQVEREGITTRTWFDAEGRVLSVVRIGSDGSEISLETNVYDQAGRLVERRDAMDRVTTHLEEIQPWPGIAKVRTTTAPDGGTRIESINHDGSLASISGTAVPPRTFRYGVDADGIFTKEIRAESGGDMGPPLPGGPEPDGAEWVKTSTDFLGRTWKTLYPDGATAYSYFNAKGQLVRTVDPDGITMLHAYNARGEQETVALDLNGNGVIDFDGTDRITRTVAEVGVRDAGTVARVTTQVWETDGVNTPTIVAVSEQGPDGLRSWQTTRGLTTSIVTMLDGLGGRTTTTTAPDGVQTVQTHDGDRLVATTVRTGGGLQLSAVTYGHDTHGRLAQATDARNGMTTYTYFADDQIESVTTPDPDPTQSGPGYDPQVTTYGYDSAGRVETVTLPDGGVVHTTYWPTGQVQRNWGARTYPVEYTYDPQGRLQTLTTWQDFAGDGGRAVTTWEYEPQRGWLTGKRYADGAGPSYDYYPSGRLQTRTWARNPEITTTYTYNAAGEVVLTDYSDSTPDVAIGYDRLGRPREITDGSGTRMLTYHASGQLDTESYTGGSFDGLGLDRDFDSLSRLSGMAMFATGYSLPTAEYFYDPASRLHTVTSGPNTVTYGYGPNSSLVETVTFKQSGATRLTTTKAHDHLNRLSAISNQPSASGFPPIAYSYTYNAANQRTKAVRENGEFWSYAYDALGQVTAGTKHLADETPVYGLDYAWTFDEIGNRKTAMVNSQLSTYTSTLLNAYSARTVPGVVGVLGAARPEATVTVMTPAADGTVHPVERQGELYHLQLPVDNSGSAVFASLKVTGVANHVGPEGEDAVAEETRGVLVPATPEIFSHDEDGNLIADARWTYAWDAENRLVAMETTASALAAGAPGMRLEFGYDGQSRRVTKKVFNWNGTAWLLVSSTRFLYDGWNMIAELDALNGHAPVRTHVWGLDLSGTLQGAGGVGGLLFGTSTLGSGPSTFASTFDGNGNVIGLVDLTTGATTAAYDYNAFGETVISEGPVADENPFRFSTKYTDAETGLLYYGFRYFQPSIGRWLNRDPIEEEGGANLYGFVASDPISNVDVLGLAGYFFDGTGNRERDRTNVSILLEAYDGLARYYPGVGSSLGTRIVGGLTGAGGHNRLEAAYRDFIRFIDAGDRYVDIFGFSRGGALAREFANLLNERGYDPKYGGNLKHKLRAGTNKPPGECEFVIRFIGLFDSVGSFGVPGNDINIGIRMDLPGTVGKAAQATAQNERRLLFPLTPLGTRDGFGEQSFPGDHSDIGRGHRRDNNDLSRAPLEYVWRQGKAAGVPFRDLPQYTPTGNTTPHDLSRKFPHNLFPKRSR